MVTIQPDVQATETVSVDNVKELADADVVDIVAFLGALTGEYPVITMPRLPATPGTSIVAAQSN